MPQSYAAGAIFLARAVLEQGAVEEFEAATRLSPAQLARTRRSMEAAHHARRIPAGDQAFLERARRHGRYEMARTIDIDDERLHYIWNRFREHAVLLLKALAEPPQGLVIASQWAAGLRTRECTALLKLYRAEYDRRRAGSDKAAAVLRRAVLSHVDAQVHVPHDSALLQRLFGS